MDPKDLYGLPLDRFTKERNALARQLRQAGDREEAREVAKLSKPSLAAWTVNQLVRTQRREIDKLFRAGEALQRLQAELISGRGDPTALRRAVDSERQAVDQLTGRARGLLSSEGHELTPARLEQVSETLHAAALDLEARDRVSQGCLDRELRHIGLGAPGGSAGAPKRAPAGRRPAQTRRGQKPAADDPRADTAARRALERAEGQARRRIERAERELGRAQERLERSADSLRQAEQAVRDAGEGLASARREHEQAERRRSG